MVRESREELSRVPRKRKLDEKLQSRMRTAE